jgi:hypothetical protein
MVGKCSNIIKYQIVGKWWHQSKRNIPIVLFMYSDSFDFGQMVATFQRWTNVFCNIAMLNFIIIPTVGIFWLFSLFLALWWHYNRYGSRFYLLLLFSV